MRCEEKENQLSEIHDEIKTLNQKIDDWYIFILNKKKKKKKKKDIYLFKK